MRLGTLFAAALLTASAVYAQTATWEQKPGGDVVINRRIGPPVGAGAFSSGPIQVTQFTSETVKSAPYSAEAVTETVQTLSDGNRIINKNTVKMYRDSEGRTRTESTIQPIGPWVTDGKSQVFTMIYDPVAGEHYTLNNDTKTATKAVVRIRVLPPDVKSEADGPIVAESRREVHVVTSGPGVKGETIDVVGEAKPAAGAVAMAFPPIRMSTMAFAESGDVQTTSLGKRSIEGVECEGTKTVMTIPAGRIGNERAIEIVTETWRSAELKMDLLRKHTDPRFGETTYQVNSLIRSEQPRSLFEIPTDFKTDELNQRFPNVVPMRRTAPGGPAPELF